MAKASIQKLATAYIGAAQQAARSGDHARVSKIYRKAAAALIGLSRDPRNARSAKRLQTAAMDFVGAASRWKEAITLDDFTNLLQETADAYAQAGDDPMDLIARRREIHDEQTPQAPGSMSIAPATFNQDATLGRSAVIKFAPTSEETAIGIQQSQTVAFWQGVKKEAQAITVDCALVSPPPPGIGDDGVNSPLSVRPYGIVEYGSDGNRTSVVFDVGIGKRFTVVGNYVSLLVGCDPPGTSQAGIVDPTTPITVGASIGTFAAPSQASVTRTIYVDLLDNGQQTDLLPIPIKATALLSIQSNMAATEGAELDFFAYGGGAFPITKLFYQQSATTFMPPFPLYGDEWFVRVKNNATGARNFRLVFQLSM